MEGALAIDIWRNVPNAALIAKPSVKGQSYGWEAKPKEHHWFPLIPLISASAWMGSTKEDHWVPLTDFTSAYAMQSLYGWEGLRKTSEFHLSPSPLHLPLHG